MVVVLGGTKGQAYHVALNLSELMNVTITPIDKVTGQPDASKATSVRPARCVWCVLCFLFPPNFIPHSAAIISGGAV